MDLSVAVGTYDRTRPLLVGDVKIGSANVSFVNDSLEAMFSAALTTSPADVAELSFSNYVVQLSAGTAAYVGLPVFPSRGFRHSAIYVSRGSGISSPEDLKGRRVGLREYSNTAALVVRGMLADEYGVLPSEIEWLVGDIDEPERTEIKVPSITGTSITPVVGEDLSSLLSAGRLDALVAYEAPRCAAPGGDATRLFEDYASLEQSYFQRTGIFPIMHLVGIKRTTLEEHPHLGAEVTRAFAEAKRIAISDLFVQQALKTSLPWGVSEAQRTVAVMGNDFWPYGAGPNTNVLEAQLRYSWEQGLSSRPVEVSELFVPDPSVESAALA